MYGSIRNLAENINPLVGTAEFFLAKKNMRKLTGGWRSVRVEKFSLLFRDVCKLNEKVLIYPFAAGCIANDFAPGNAEISSHFAYPHSHTKRHLCIQIVYPERSQQKDIKIRILFWQGGQIKVVSAYGKRNGKKVGSACSDKQFRYSSQSRLSETCFELKMVLLTVKHISILFDVCKSLNCSIGKTSGKLEWKVKLLL